MTKTNQSVQAPVLQQPQRPIAPNKAITTHSNHVVRLMYMNKNTHHCLLPLEYPLQSMYNVGRFKIRIIAIIIMYMNPQQHSINNQLLNAVLDSKGS